MARVMMAKLPFETKLFRKNQKVWVQFMSGDMAFKVKGRFKGSGRYISAWVSWNETTKPRPDWKTFPVKESFAERHGLLRQ